MYESEDNYTVCFSKQLDNVMLSEFQRFISDCDYENDQVLEVFNSIYKSRRSFDAESSYDECHLLLWALYQAFGEFELEGQFREIGHPPGCRYEIELHFRVNDTKYFELEIETILSHDEEELEELLDGPHDSEECGERQTDLEMRETYLSTNGNMEELTRKMLADMLMSAQP
jgi:hypothetical protein